jgi:glycosyltransferase involved in cell wall biosynthesis
MPRVLAIIPGFPDRAEAWPPSLLLERLAHRVDLTVATWSYPDRPRPYWHRQVHVIPLRRLRRASPAALAELIPRPDLVHGFWALQPGALAVALAALWRRPAVVSALGGEVTDLPPVGFGSTGSLWLRGLARASLAAADAVVVGSQLQLQACWRLARLRRSLVLPVGIHERFVPQPRRPADGTVRLLAVGSLVAVKRVALLVEALAQLPARFTLALAGDGPLRAALEAQVKALGLLGRVRFLGELKGEEILAALRDADLVVHASAHEGGCIALLEALASERPVVSTRVGAAPELLAEGAGTLSEGTPRELAQAIERTVANLERVHRPAVERTSREVRARWGVEAVAAELEALYADLTDRGGARRAGRRG